MNIVRRKRIEKGFSVGDMANRLNITKSNYIEYEIGLRNINAFLYMKICQLLDI